MQLLQYTCPHCGQITPVNAGQASATCLHCQGEMSLTASAPPVRRPPVAGQPPKSERPGPIVLNAFDISGSSQSLKDGLRHVPSPGKIGGMMLIGTIIAVVVFGGFFLAMIAAIFFLTPAFR